MAGFDIEVVKSLEPGKRRGARQAFVFRLCGRR
jgi:hypothetical protein